MLETLLNDRYKILRVLGSGGFGKTYLAEDLRQSSLRCVVKQFQPIRQDPLFLQTARRLFVSEVESLRRLGSHDQIPTLIDDFEEDHEFYLVQEYVEGRSLSQEFLTTRRLSEADVTNLLRDVLTVLEFVHQHQAIHRDIKPGNLIRRQQDGRYVLIDFGAVKELQTQLTTEPGQTNLTVGIGTQGYAPSEQLMGKPRFNSDLYALGMTAIHALTGVQPQQLPTCPDTGEVEWHDRALVSPTLTAVLDRMVRYHFSQRYYSSSEVLQALDHPTEATLDDSKRTGLLYPPAVDVVAPPVERVDRKRRDRAHRLRHLLSVGVASLAVTGLLLGVRQLGWLQRSELAVFDRLVQLSPDPGPDPRLLVVSITEADIQAEKRFPISDRTVAQLLKTLKSYKPSAIGLDLLRDLPQEPGRKELLAELTAANVIAIANLGTDEAPLIPAPPGVPPDRVGFNDLAVDPDGVVRSNLLFADRGSTYYSFSLRLALRYLAAKNITPRSDPKDSNVFQLGRSTFWPLERDAGGYQALDARGYQLLLRYRGRSVARQMSLADVRSGKLKPEWVKDNIVLIGTTAPSARDVFFTPYSAAEPETAKLAGVLIHAHALSQILDAALAGRSLFWFWTDGLEVVWILGWAIVGGGLAGWIQRPIVLGLCGTAAIVVLLSGGLGLFLQHGWVPIVAPALAAVMTGGVVVAYRAYGRLGQ